MVVASSGMADRLVLRGLAIRRRRNVITSPIVAQRGLRRRSLTEATVYDSRTTTHPGFDRARTIDDLALLGEVKEPDLAPRASGDIGTVGIDESHVTTLAHKRAV